MVGFKIHEPSPPQGKYHKPSALRNQHHIANQATGNATARSLKPKSLTANLTTDLRVAGANTMAL
jgi:hypothetical protein